MPGPLRDRDLLRLVGLTDAKRKLKDMPDIVRQRLGAEVKAIAADVLASAKARAPVRTGKLPAGYAGGALRRHLAMRFNAPAASATIGIEQVAIVAGRTGRARTFARHKVKIAATGKWTRRVMSRAHETKLRAGGAVIIRPTRYGHLVEFGHRKGRGRAAASPRSFLRVAVRMHQGAFESHLRGASADVARLLASQPTTEGTT